MQRCSRLIVVDAAYDAAVERLRHAVASLTVGPPHDPATAVPPVISAEARQKCERYIAIGRASASLLVQGTAPPGHGCYVAPAVFTGVSLDSPLATEEIFGPVLSVFRARDFDDALRMALDSRFALTGGVFSRNPRHIERARRELRVGNLYINRKVTGTIVGRQPFGGLGWSGFGERAGGPDYLRQFTQTRVAHGEHAATRIRSRPWFRLSWGWYGGKQGGVLAVALAVHPLGVIFALLCLQTLGNLALAFLSLCAVPLVTAGHCHHLASATSYRAPALWVPRQRLASFVNSRVSPQSLQEPTVTPLLSCRLRRIQR